MQSKDIKVGTDYAVGASRLTLGSPWLVRATVIAEPAAGKVQVRRADRPDAVSTVKTRDIPGTWDDHQQEVIAKHQRARDAAASLDRAVEARRVAQERVLHLLGDAAPYWVKGEIKAHADRSGIQGGVQYGSFTINHLLPLLEAAAATGVLDAEETAGFDQ